MVVAHILQSNIYSGAENVVCQIIELFSKKSDIEMIYVSPSGSIDEILRTKNIKHYILDSFSIGDIKKAIKSIKPDIIVSKIRGNVDLIEEGISGYLVKPQSVNSWGMRIKQVSSDREFMAHLGINNLKRIASFSLFNVEKRISEVYLNTIDY